jgi:hypothetical protein
VIAPARTLRGRHTGKLMDAASGKQVSWTGIAIYRIQAGRGVDERGVQEGLGFLWQIGAITAS